MKRFAYMLFLSFLSAAAVANPDPALSREHPWEGSYVSYLRGEAYGRQDGVEEFGMLETNMPLQEGDRLIAGENSMLGITLYGGAMLWLDAGTPLGIERIYREPSLSMVQGQLFVRNPDDSSEATDILIVTPVASASVPPGSLTQVCVDKGGTLSVSVWEGSAQVYAGRASVAVPAHYRLVVQGDGQGFVSAAFNPEPQGAFEGAALALAVQAAEDDSTQYVQKPLNGVGRLRDYGSWYYDSMYACYVWAPRVDAHWRPYMYGRWLYHPCGMYWVTDDPWGYAPYHYGRWVVNRRGRWCWVPGYSFSPAYVSFYSFGGYYAWAPMGFDPYGYGYDGFVYADTDCLYDGCGHHHRHERHRKDGYRSLTDEDCKKTGFEPRNLRRVSIDLRKGPVRRFLKEYGHVGKRIREVMADLQGAQPHREVLQRARDNTRFFRQGLQAARDRVRPVLKGGTGREQRAEAIHQPSKRGSFTLVRTLQNAQHSAEPRNTKVPEALKKVRAKAAENQAAAAQKAHDRRNVMREKVRSRVNGIAFAQEKRRTYAVGYRRSSRPQSYRPTPRFFSGRPRVSGAVRSASGPGPARISLPAFGARIQAFRR